LQKKQRTHKIKYGNLTSGTYACTNLKNGEMILKNTITGAEEVFLREYIENQII